MMLRAGNNLAELSLTQCLFSPAHSNLLTEERLLLDEVFLQEAPAGIYSQFRHLPVHSWQRAGAVKTCLVNLLS